MKECHVSSVHRRYDVRIFEKECVSLAKNGHEVFFLVNDEEKDEQLDNVKIVSTGRLLRSRKERFEFTKKGLLQYAMDIDAQIYHLHDPDLLLLASKLRKQGKVVIFDSHEDVPKQIMDKEWIPKMLRRFISKTYAIYQGRIFKKISAVIGATPDVAEQAKRYNNNAVVVTNFPIVDDAFPRHNYENYVCYTGGISKQWCHENVIQALEQTTDVKYLLAGKIDEDYFEQLRGLSGWPNVTYLGMLPHHEVKGVFEKSFAGIAINYASQTKGKGNLANTKLFEYMAAEIPVICTDFQLWREIVEGNHCGICVRHDDIEGVRSAIEYLRDNPDKAGEMGRNGRKAILEKYNWKVEERKLLDLYNKLQQNIMK